MLVAKKRIAKGSGTTVQEINRLIKQFDDMKKNDENDDWNAKR